ncbi:hypothetical protein EJ03DRAFT_330792 [Teratosphaeria nubilosa]|uniref:Uncharacterized protein n=1 Tax=Teratosphaeria nubilosa TaxID=161662 RepID=A0A6G1KYY4_9PEZI|nr:hypothetical protein EJ03DRAFT_330792 [Teratosphaeria nubilosa]
MPSPPVCLGSTLGVGSGTTVHRTPDSGTCPGPFGTLNSLVREHKDLASAASQNVFGEVYVIAKSRVSPTTLTRFNVVSTRLANEESSTGLGCGAL